MENTEQVLLDGRLFIYKWETKNPKAAIFIIHGFAEHAGRYHSHAEFFNSKGLNVYALDLTGHGKSKGLPAHIKRFEDYEEDVRLALEHFRSLHTNLKFFAWGHSMGGLLLTKSISSGKLNNIAGSIITNAGFDITSNQPKFLIGLVRFLAKIFPKMKTVPLNSKDISGLVEEREKYDQDPLNYRKGTRPGMINRFDRAGQWMRSNAKLFKESILVIYSSKDKTVYNPASRQFYEDISSSDKKLKEYENSYHEIHNDIDKEALLNEIINWINLRI